MVETRGGGIARRVAAKLLARLIDPEVAAQGGDALRRTRTAVIVLLIVIALLPVSVVDHLAAGRMTAGASVSALTPPSAAPRGASTWSRR